MADPVSTVGTVAGLASLAIQLSQISYQYVSSVADASKTWTSYIQELSALTSVILQLQSVNETLQQHESVPITGPQVIAENDISNCMREMGQLKAKLEAKLGRRGFKGKVEALAWPFSEADTKKKVDTLHRFRDIFSSAFVVNNLTVSIASYREHREQRQDHEFHQVLEWLRPDYTPLQFGTAIEDRCPGTVLWFLEKECYLNWRDGPENCLWAYGQPGAGKTILTAAVLEDLRIFGVKGSVIAYYFFRADSKEDSLQRLLRQIVFQSQSQFTTIIPEALDLMKRHKTSANNLSPNDLVSLLISAFKRSPNMYIVLDGLDECPYWPKAKRYLATLRESGIKMFVTGRDLPNIKQHLEPISRVEVKASRDDIDQYVNWRLSEESVVEYDSLEDDFKKEISSRLSQHVDGSFLLVQLLMNDICGQTTKKKIRRLLQMLPTNLVEAYRDTFNRIKAQPTLRDLALKTLNWVTNAKRPLTMEELQHGIAAQENENVIESDDLESPKVILSASLGLIRFSKSGRTVQLIHSSARSFLQGLQDDIDPSGEFTIGRACLGYLSSTEMAKGACHTLDAFSSRLRQLPFLDYAARFYGYHIQGVERNCLAELQFFLGNPALVDSSWQVLHFMLKPSHVMAQEVFNNTPCRASALHLASYWGFSELLAVLLEVEPGGKVPPTIDIPDSRGWTPLHWAASMGHINAVIVLLRCGAAVDPLDLDRWTPLFWATVKGHSDVVRLLIERKANVLNVDADGLAPLHWSISMGHSIITSLLREAIDRETAIAPEEPLRYSDPLGIHAKELTVAKAKQMIAPYQTPNSILQVAAGGVDPETISWLINETPEVVEASFGFHPCSSSIEPLFRMLWRVRSKSDYMFWHRQQDHHMAFRAKLLEKAMDDENATFLEALLNLEDGLRVIDKFPTLNYRGEQYLHKACSRYNPQVAIVLVAKGQNVNQTDKDGKTPLHYACERGSPEIVSVLLADKTTLVDAKDNYGRTPLLTLLQLGRWRTQHHPEDNMSICRMLVGKGASINEVDEEGNTMAILAARLWDPDVVKLMVSSGVGFSNPKYPDMTALHALAIAPYSCNRKGDGIDSNYETNYEISPSIIRSTVELVWRLCSAETQSRSCCVDTERLPSIVDHWGCRFSFEGTALPLAMVMRNWAMACQLNKLGASFITNQPLHRMLADAAEVGVPELVERLLSMGANVNLSRNDSDPGLGEYHPWSHIEHDAPLLWAVRGPGQKNKSSYLATRDCLSTVQVLITAGAEVDRVGNSGMTALGVAIKEGAATDIISALLNAGANPYVCGSEEFDCFQLGLLNGSPSNLTCLWDYFCSRTNEPPHHHWLHNFNHSESPTGHQHSHRQLLVFALSQASAVNFKDRDGHTLLFNAALEGNKALAEDLIMYGADIDAADPAGWTPLLAAASTAHTEMARILLKAGANIHEFANDTYLSRGHEWCREKDANSYPKPLHLALTPNPVPELVRLLLDHGADPNERYASEYLSDNKSPLSLVVKLFHRTHNKDALKAMEILLESGAVVGDEAKHLSLEDVAQFDGYEHIWDALREGVRDLPAFSQSGEIS